MNLSTAALKAFGSSMCGSWPQLGKPIRVDPEPCGIVSGAGSVWTHAYGGTRLDRINTRTRKVTRIRIGHGSYDVLFAAGSAWVTNNSDDTVSRVDPATNRVIATIRVEGGPAGLAFAAGRVWVGTNGGGTDIVRIDPASGRVSSYLDLTGLLPASQRRDEGAVLNGIAYDPATRRVFVSGKLWPVLFEIRVR